MSENSEAVIRYRKRIKRTMIEAMGNECQVCSYNKCDEAMEFHHLDPMVKEHGFGQLRANPRRIELLIEELKKVVLLCSNCHKEVHAGIASVPANHAVLDEAVMWRDYRKRPAKKQDYKSKPLSEEHKKKISSSIKKQRYIGVV